ncbi:hypothetical protein HO173_003895 [Letharia columbiana]|uniref:Uncharacterized protein n=1 Tax=Letharia columbiana TaxID=112416 RepID=A0A8H6FZH9_9LECA|nr:uncharacterized protein HO173_003895 [Letharia columbiana]KAF6237694.1 hypothetical protein HO173_003895 [Letharia columbiana]
MATEEYISPYAVDKRTRRSVLAALVDNRSINDTHNRDSRRATAKFRPAFNGESFASALGIITVVVEGLLIEGAGVGDGERRLIPERPRGSSRAPIYLGTDRATLSLYDPLENLKEMLDTFCRGVMAWANKPTYFKEVTRPFIIRTIENSISEASTARKLRKSLEYVGPIDTGYVNSFEAFRCSMQDPILELRHLGEFIESIIAEGDEISAHPAKILNPAVEASDNHRSSSPYFNTILNPEPATQASTGGRVKTESTASERGGAFSGFEDLLEAAGYGFGMHRKSQSPENKPEREAKPELQYPGSPSYSPPPSPSVSIDALLQPFSVSSIQAEEHLPDVSSSILLQPSNLYRIKPCPAPPGTPKWKIDLSGRKGHPIRILHVGPRELDILAKCLPLVHKATLKGEECMRVIVEKENLATEMGAEYKQWDDFCSDLEDNVSIDAKEAGAKSKQDSGDTKIDDTKGNGKGEAKDPSVYGAVASGGKDWFGSADPSAYGRVGPGDDPDTAWGYRKLDPPTFQTAKAKTPRRTAAADVDPDATEDEDEDDDDTGFPRDFGLGSRSPTERAFGTASPRPGSDSGSEGGEEVMRFEEAVGGVDDGLDREMVDVGGWRRGRLLRRRGGRRGGGGGEEG